MERVSVRPASAPPERRGSGGVAAVDPALPQGDCHPFLLQGPSHPVTHFSTSSRVKACVRRSSVRVPAPQRLSPWPYGGTAGPCRAGLGRGLPAAAHVYGAGRAGPSLFGTSFVSLHAQEWALQRGPHSLVRNPLSLWAVTLSPK